MTPKATKEEDANRAIWNPTPGTIHIGDAINRLKDGQYAKEIVSDYVLGIFFLAESIGIIKKWEGSLLQWPFTKNMKLRKVLPHVGEPFNGPDGKPIYHAGRLLCGHSGFRIEEAILNQWARSEFNLKSMKKSGAHQSWLKHHLYADREKDDLQYRRTNVNNSKKSCDDFVNSALTRIRAPDVTNQLDGDGAIYPKAISVKDAKKIDVGGNELRGFEGVNDAGEGGEVYRGIDAILGGDWLDGMGYEGNFFHSDLLQGNLLQEGENSRWKGKGSASCAISESQHLSNSGLRVADLSGRDFRDLTPDFNLSPAWNQLSNAELSEILMSAAPDLNQQRPFDQHSVNQQQPSDQLQLFDQLQSSDQLQPPIIDSISDLTPFGLFNNFEPNPNPSNATLGFDSAPLSHNNALQPINESNVSIDWGETESISQYIGSGGFNFDFLDSEGAIDEVHKEWNCSNDEERADGAPNESRGE
ncbi:hypothetical protein BCIN_02g00010 [Botrytis cinerea B05.10]|uniref:Uncharacterized protein n=2 Tax=Botryotinia fuckeliana TaxID=40559 RepID=A0A384J858_BOTFB|nr:hypothetical protein BCIN_02g00010 [Botrytis cinerea B05.10]ATZ46597.1 hypothetical protein BCIN_02g00010 [Botrytis cinerea B05.10]EMR85512.1 hypothetical protein BcDW1_5854 [Botrytis cinerea BcDW1]